MLWNLKCYYDELGIVMKWAGHSGNQMRTKCSSGILQKRDHTGNFRHRERITS
jgi:hypothetical protein